MTSLALNTGDQYPRHFQKPGFPFLYLLFIWRIYWKYFSNISFSFFVLFIFYQNNLLSNIFYHLYNILIIKSKQVNRLFVIFKKKRKWFPRLIPNSRFHCNQTLFLIQTSVYFQLLISQIGFNHERFWNVDSVSLYFLISYFYFLRLVLTVRDPEMWAVSLSKVLLPLVHQLDR